MSLLDFLTEAGEAFSAGMWVLLFQPTAHRKPYPGGIRGPFSPMDGVSLAFPNPCQIQRKLPVPQTLKDSPKIQKWAQPWL